MFYCILQNLSHFWSGVVLFIIFFIHIKLFRFCSITFLSILTTYLYTYPDLLNYCIVIYYGLVNKKNYLVKLTRFTNSIFYWSCTRTLWTTIWCYKKKTVLHKKYGPSWRHVRMMRSEQRRFYIFELETNHFYILFVCVIIQRIWNIKGKLACRNNNKSWHWCILNFVFLSVSICCFLVLKQHFFLKHFF